MYKFKNKKTKISTIFLFVAISFLVLSGCKGKDGEDGFDGLDATVYYSEWFSPSVWSGTSGDWYFNASAPDLTQDVVENGLVLAYVWLAGDVYNGTSVRPLPAYAVNANWSFLISEYGSIEFITDMISEPLTSGNKFRFIAIPGNIQALKSASLTIKSNDELKNMSYKDVCNYFNIHE